MGGNESGSPAQEEFLAGGGKMGERVRAFDWQSHPIGPVSGWPQSLRSALSICLNSGFPIALYWGSDLRLLYNDEWSPILGGKHPWALGRPARETWPEIWDIIEPLFSHVLATGEATRSRDQLLPMNRHGFTEECYFDYTFTPIRGESGKVEGIFNAVLETTNRVIGERRLKTLRELTAPLADKAKSAEEACRAAAQVLAANPHDLPFARVYLLDHDGEATLCGITGAEQHAAITQPVIQLSAIDSPWPLSKVAETSEAVIVDDLVAKVGPLLGGAWPEMVQQAVVLPLSAPGHAQLAGFVVAGVSPRLPLGEDYRTFLELLAGHVTASIANARAHEEEKKRAEALAELDRAKTAFFSNVSHEFRTPLTLMLGPVEELLARSHTDLPPAAAGQLEVVNRNGLRLLRLVNSLLDFSRIEAGRVRARFQPTDLATFTTDLASSFRSACERAGLRLVVDCPHLGEPVFVDREMWEKVVLNLVSNAFKFTFDGEIAVSLQLIADTAELRVRDTGAGIPAEEIPRLFERFHRIEKTRGRTHEGSGIGLALVQELVRLHRGTVTAESVLGQGTTFIVTVPLGHAHLPEDQVGDARGGFALGAGPLPFVEEALRWLPNTQQDDFQERLSLPQPTPTVQQPASAEDDRPRVLVADDNADLRNYIARLLAESFRVEVVPDGEAALAAARERAPDLVLTDVMMPRLDGFGLLEALRTDSRTSQLPVVMLSARAGEESRVEGLEAGADDYLVKPFSARELLARVTVHIQMSRLRRESERAVRESDERLRVTFASIGDAVLTTDTTGSITNINPVAESLTGWSSSEAIGQPLENVFRIVNETTSLPVENPAARALREGVVVGLANHTVLIAKDGTRRPIDDSAAPIRSREGEVIGSVLVFRDVTERRAAEKRLQERELRYRLVGHAANDAIWDWDLVTNEVVWNEGVRRVFGYREQDIGASAAWWVANIHPEDRDRITKDIHDAIDSDQEFWQNEYLYQRADGSYAAVYDRGQIVREDGKPVRMVGSMLDLTERKRAEAALRAAEERLAFVRKSSGVGVWYCDLPFDTLQWDEHVKTHFHLPADAHVTIETFYDRIHPDDREPTRAAIDRSIHERTSYDVFYRTVDPQSGGEKWIRAIGRTFYDADERPIRFDGVTLDVTEQKRAEAELRELAAVLSEAGHRKDEFLATLAHELRNPLAPIRNALQLMRLSHEPDMQEHAKNLMERQLSQMVRLVDDLMDVSRITRGKVELRKEHVPLAVVINSAVETSRPLIEQMGHKLEVSLPSHPLLVDGDVTRLAQVFSNLLNNAAKYSEQGSEIDVIVDRRGDDALVSVRDTGIGIAADHLPHIFEMFTQVDRSLERSQGGLGIGLTLVRRLVEMHGGSVEAKSKGLGHGSEFIVRLPLMVDASSQRIHPKHDQAPPTSSLRILIVDDNQDGANSLAMMLKLIGNETRTAYDGEEGVSLAETYRPDVILFDIGLPKLNGYEACRRIREQPWGKTPVIIAVTGWGQDEDRRRSHEAGFDHHLVKPVDPRALMHLLATYRRSDSSSAKTRR
jgi:PAS domain S-box-containing protein